VLLNIRFRYMGFLLPFAHAMFYSDSVTSLGPGFQATAHSSSGLLAACENTSKQIYAVQFHPEVDLTQHGTELFRNFLYKVSHTLTIHLLHPHPTLGCDK
jgi:GMP synthase-like glutamine amidotransferase